MNQLWQLADEMQGGFGEQSKFPMVPQLQALMHIYQQSADERLGRFLQLTLDQMASQGLRDQIGGGFFRYTVDPNWQVPHFEKMLYDNALLTALYLDAAEVFKRDDYRRVGMDTLDFMLHEMRHPDGAFISSLSAIDKQNIEGGYYLWQEQELTRLLTAEEYTIASRYWQLYGNSPLDNGYHAIQTMGTAEVAKELNISEKEVVHGIDAARKKLFIARQTRSLPRDDKRLAAWNGLALSALSRAVRITKAARYRDAAAQTERYLTQVLWDGNELLRARSEKNSLGRAGVEDYALVAQGLQDWYEVSGEGTGRETVHTLVSQAWKRFYDNGWRRSEEQFLQYGNHDALLPDDVLPSASATLIRLSLVMDDQALQKQARQALYLSHEVLQSEPFWYVGYLTVLAP